MAYLPSRLKSQAVNANYQANVYHYASLIDFNPFNPSQLKVTEIGSTAKAKAKYPSS